MPTLYIEFIPLECIPNIKGSLPSAEELKLYEDNIESISDDYKIFLNDNDVSLHSKINRAINKTLSLNTIIDDEIITIKWGNLIPIISIRGESRKYIKDILQTIINDHSANGLSIISRRIDTVQHGRWHITNVAGYYANYIDQLGLCIAPIDDTPLKFIISATKKALKDSDAEKK